MEKYEYYSLKELIQDDEFIKWVKSPTSERDEYWRLFRSKFPNKVADIEYAAKLINSFSDFCPIIEEEIIEATKIKILKMIS